MKIKLFITFTMMLALVSCGQKVALTSVSSNEAKIVLGAFNDMTTSSSYNQEALSALPQVVNFSDKMTAVKNQGYRGTCTFFATAALIEAAIKLDKGIDVNLSEEFLIYSTKKQGHYSDVEASHVSVNLQSVKEGGLLLEKDWSYFPSFFEPGKPCAGIDGENTNAPMKCYVHSPTPSILGKIIPATSIKTGFMRKNTNEIIKYLAKNERPLTISLPVNYKGWKDSGEVTYTEEMRQECLVDTSKCGAHSIILTGYNIEEQVFYFKNSWGSDWGENGFGKLSFEMVDRYIDGYLYFAKVDGDLNIPADANVDNFKIESYVVRPTITEDDIDLDISIKASQDSGRYIEVNNYFGFTIHPKDQKPEYYPFYNANYDYIFTTASSLDVDMTGNRETHVGLPENILQDDKVKSVRSQAPLYQLALKSVVMLYTDTSVKPLPVLQVIEPLSN